MTLPTDIQNAFEALQRKVSGQLQSADEELAHLREDRDKIYQQALDLSRQLEDLLRARDVMESELISARLEAKQAQGKLALISDEPAQDRKSVV